ncbi:MAG: hypothetical protein ACOX6W_00425 [Lentisphaeria bacterium]|jgi:hypothetical protein
MVTSGFRRTKGAFGAPGVPLPEPKAKEGCFCLEFAVIWRKNEPFQFLTGKKRLRNPSPPSPKKMFLREIAESGHDKAPEMGDFSKLPGSACRRCLFKLDFSD